MSPLEKLVFHAREAIVVPGNIQADTAVETQNRELAITAALKNLNDFGYVLDRQGIERLCFATKEEIMNWYHDTSAYLSEVTGNRHNYHPFYPNFPEEVMQLSEGERIIDQILHYITGYRPQEENLKKAIPSLEAHPNKLLKSITPEDVPKLAKEAFVNILHSKETPSEGTMKNIVIPYMQYNAHWTQHADRVENRNLLAYLYTEAMRSDLSTKSMPSLITNDYLRIAKTFLYLEKQGDDRSICDFSDIEQERIGSLPRKYRNFILRGLDSQKNLEEDVARNTIEWKKMFRLLHTGSYHQYQNLQRVTDKVRNDLRLETFYSKIEAAIKRDDFTEALRLYGTRPGEMIKNFNRLLKMAENNPSEREEMLAKVMSDCFAKNRPEDLLTFAEYVKGRGREDYLGVHYVNGQCILSEKKYPTFNQELVQTYRAMAVNAAIKQLNLSHYQGKVYIDPGLFKIPMPKNTRDTSDALNQYPKGSRLPIERGEHGAKNIRAFIWWTNNPDTVVDIDLSANFFKETDTKEKHLEPAGSLSYHSTFDIYGCVHSGDITNGGAYGGDGAAEFVDLNMQKLKEEGIRYVQIYVNVFNGGTFQEIPCEAGWMEREELDLSNQFDIKAVKQHSNLSGNHYGLNTFLVDVNAEEILWLDAPNLRVRNMSNSSNVLRDCEVLLDRYGKGDRISMGEYLTTAFSGQKTVELVQDKEQADYWFTVNPEESKKREICNITCKDTRIIDEFMTPAAEDNLRDREPDKMVEIEESVVEDNIVEAGDFSICLKDTDEEPQEEQEDELEL